MQFITCVHIDLSIRLFVKALHFEGRIWSAIQERPFIEKPQLNNNNYVEKQENIIFLKLTESKLAYQIVLY